MKVLQVNCVYKKGSTGKIVADIHEHLIQQGVESVVCYGRGKKVKEKNVYKTCSEFYAKFNNLFSRISGMPYGGCYFSTQKLIRIIKKERPDVVHLHCINGYFVNIYKLVTFLKKSGIKTVLTLHAEFMHTANCGHAYDCNEWKTGCKNCPRWREENKSLFFNRTHASWMKMKKAFDGFNNLTVVSVSSWLMDRAKQSPILEDKRHEVILNGVDTEVFKCYEDKGCLKEFVSEGEKIVFHVTPSFSDDVNHNKGGYYVIKLAEMLEEKKIKFIVAGNYQHGIKAPNNIVFLGQIKDQTQLAKYYSVADVTLLTSKRETFSMVCAESLCCGTSVVGFNAGAPEQVAIREFSRFVEYGDINALRDELLSVLDVNSDKQAISACARNKYADNIMIEKFVSIYRS